MGKAQPGRAVDGLTIRRDASQQSVQNCRLEVLQVWTTSSQRHLQQGTTFCALFSSALCPNIAKGPIPTAGDVRSCHTPVHVCFTEALWAQPSSTWWLRIGMSSQQSQYPSKSQSAGI